MMRVVVVEKIYYLCVFIGPFKKLKKNPQKLNLFNNSDFN
jgi:hypothetical protein